jgi:hypothetical protein
MRVLTDKESLHRAHLTHTGKVSLHRVYLTRRMLLNTKGTPFFFAKTQERPGQCVLCILAFCTRCSHVQAPPLQQYASQHRMHPTLLHECRHSQESTSDTYTHTHTEYASQHSMHHTLFHKRRRGPGSVSHTGKRSAPGADTSKQPTTSGPPQAATPAGAPTTPPGAPGSQQAAASAAAAGAKTTGAEAGLGARGGPAGARLVSMSRVGVARAGGSGAAHNNTGVAHSIYAGYKCSH